MAGRLEHVDGVVGDGVDQQLEALLGDMGVELELVGHSIPVAGPARCAGRKPQPRQRPSAKSMGVNELPARAAPRRHVRGNPPSRTLAGLARR